MKKTATLLLALLLTTTIPHATPTHPTTQPYAAVLIPDTTPLLGLLAASLACTYDPATNTTTLLPLLLTHHNTLTATQNQLLATLLDPTDTILSLNTTPTTSYPTHQILGTPTAISYTTATTLYQTAPTTLLIPTDNYSLGLTAAPLASYLHIPLLLTDTNTTLLTHTLTQLHTTTAILIGPTNLTLPNITIDHLTTPDQIHHRLLQETHHLFNTINYLTLTNPTDATPPTTTNTTTNTTTTTLHATQLTLLGHTTTLTGNATTTLPLTIPDGITQLTITAATPTTNRLLPTLLFLRLTDPNGTLAAYTTSQATTTGTAQLQTLTCHDPGTYPLTIRAFHGLQGGYFSRRGVSHINTTITITTTKQTQTTPHHPLIPNLSMLAPYLTAAHGGIIIPTDHEPHRPRLRDHSHQHPRRTLVHPQSPRLQQPAGQPDPRRPDPHPRPPRR